MSHGEQNDDVSATAAAAAVVLGVGDGVRHVIKDKEDQASRLITPGDQRHIPHPVDDFVAGISGAWQKLTTPADMNIKHSMHPVDALNDAHEALVRATADNFAAKGLTQGLRELSAFATAAAIENVDPFKKFNALENIAEVANTADAAVHAEQAGKVLQVGAKVTPIPIDWNTYEHLLGQGSQPPKLKPLRDFSGLMHYRPPGPFEGFSRLEYVPYPNHKIIMYLQHELDNAWPPNITLTKMGFVVRANKLLHQEAGSGSEMFHSGMALIRAYGIKIDRIDGEWSGADLTTNYYRFVGARAQGATIEEAIAMTPTGKWVANEGYTVVGGDRFIYAMNMPTLPRELHPEFTRPVFSDNEAYNAYGNAWAGSQGRSRVELHPRHEVQSGQLPASALSAVEQELKQLPPAQHDEVMQRILANWDRQLANSGLNIDLGPELK